jgi:hypothetical protein
MVYLDVDKYNRSLSFCQLSAKKSRITDGPGGPYLAEERGSNEI